MVSVRDAFFEIMTVTVYIGDGKTKAETVLLLARSGPRQVSRFRLVRARLSIFFNTGYHAGPAVGCLCLHLNRLNQNPTFQIPVYIAF